jgi:hypothetical protein
MTGQTTYCLKYRSIFKPAPARFGSSTPTHASPVVNVPGKLEPEVRSREAGDKFEEPALIPGFSLALAEILG